MPRKINFETVRKLAREAGEVLEGANFVKADGKLLAWVPPHKSVEPGSVAVRISNEQRTELVANAPAIYYFTKHYLNSETVLVRLAQIREDALKDLLRMSWSFVTKSLGARTGARRLKAR
jgi:hypothetical protein